MLRGNLRSKIPATLKVTWIVSFVIQVDQGSPCVETHEPTWGTNEPWLKLFETVGPLLHSLSAPFLKLKIELTKLQASTWNTLMGLLSLAITNLWKVDLRFKYLKVNQNEMLFQRSMLKIENTTTRHVLIHLKKINHQCIYPVNVNSKLFHAKPLLAELDVTKGR